jgi:hypothetical protein
MSILGNLNPTPETERIAELEALLKRYRAKCRELETRLTERTLAAGLAGLEFVEHPEKIVPAKITPAWTEARKVRR